MRQSLFVRKGSSLSVNFSLELFSLLRNVNKTMVLYEGMGIHSRTSHVYLDSGWRAKAVVEGSSISLRLIHAANDEEWISIRKV